MIAPPNNITMLDIVMSAFERAGGTADLQRVYPHVEKIFLELNRPFPEKLDEQVRQTIYLHCQASLNFANNGEFFVKLGRGRYKVKRPTADDFMI